MLSTLDAWVHLVLTSPRAGNKTQPAGLLANFQDYFHGYGSKEARTSLCDLYPMWGVGFTVTHFSYHSFVSTQCVLSFLRIQKSVERYGWF